MSWITITFDSLPPLNTPVIGKFGNGDVRAVIRFSHYHPSGSPQPVDTLDIIYTVFDDQPSTGLVEWMPMPE